MSENAIKVSELSRLSSPLNPVNLLLASKKTGAEFDSYAVTAGDIQALIFKDNAFDTVQAGLNATQINEQFYVYTDASKNFVEAFTNVGTSSYIPITLNGKTRRYPTAFFFENMSTVYGFDLITPVANFNMLRALPVTKEGQRVRLAGYNTGSLIGAGEFIGHFGNAVDDSGLIATGNGFYWSRVVESSLSPEMFGSLSNGLTDDSPAIIKCLLSAIANKIPVTMLPRNYVYSGNISLEIDLCNISFTSPYGRAKIDFTGCTASPAIKIYSNGVTYPNSMYQNTTNKVSGIEFIGGLISGRDGLQIGHPTYDYNGQCIIENCSFLRFDNVIVCTNNTWRYKFINCTISTGISHVFYAPADLSNSGESITFRDCQISDSNGAPFTISCNNFTVGCSGTSILNTLIEITGGASTLFMDSGGNNENPGKTTYFQYATITGNASRLVLTNVSININRPSVQTRPVFYVGPNAYIDFGFIEFPGNSYVFEQSSTDGIRAFVEGLGTVKCIGCSFQLNSGGGCIPIHGSINSLHNSGFETGDSTGWSINTQSSPSQSVVVSAVSAKNGGFGVRLTSANTNSCFIAQYISVIPGKQFSTSLNAKVITAASDAGVVGNISLQFFSSGGPSAAGTAIKSFTANFPLVTGGWGVLGAYLRGVVPPGAAYAQVSIQSRYGAVIDIDDVLINFI